MLSPVRAAEHPLYNVWGLKRNQTVELAALCSTPVSAKS